MAETANSDFPMTFPNQTHEALIRFWWASTVLKRFSRRFFASLGSSEAQFNLLIALAQANGPMTQNELSHALLVDKSNITGLLDRMEKSGLTQRNSVAGDRRSHHVTLTAAGRNLVEELRTTYSLVIAKIMESFTPDEQETLIRLTAKLRTAVAETEAEK